MKIKESERGKENQGSPWMYRSASVAAAIAGVAALEVLYGCAGDDSVEDFIEENVGEVSEALSDDYVEPMNGSPGGSTNGSTNGSPGGGVSLTGFVASLPARGGTSGSANTLSCPWGYVAVGIYGRSGSWLDQLGLNCALLQSDGTLGHQVFIGNVGGGGGGPFEFNCPKDQAIVGFQGREGWYVDQLGIRCAEINHWRFYGTVQFTSSTAGGTGGNAFDDHCPISYVLTSVRVRSGSWLDREEGVCSAIVTR